MNGSGLLRKIWNSYLLRLKLLQMISATSSRETTPRGPSSVTRRACMESMSLLCCISSGAQTIFSTTRRPLARVARKIHYIFCHEQGHERALYPGTGRSHSSWTSFAPWNNAEGGLDLVAAWLGWEEGKWLRGVDAER
jgi:hypothetical protein